MEQIRKDFDRIAALSGTESNHPGAYDRFLLKCVPSDCAAALELGCGAGAFTRSLAVRAKHVTAIDLSEEMIRLARRHSTSHANIDYRVGDILNVNLPLAEFDLIVTIATLHHLPLVPVIEKLKWALAPNGTLIIHDLLASRGVFDQALNLARFPISRVERWIRTGRLLMPRKLRRAWAEHARGERYLTLAEVRAMAESHLPGAYVKRHLLWRYTVVWRGRSTLP